MGWIYRLFWRTCSPYSTWSMPAWYFPPLALYLTRSSSLTTWCISTDPEAPEASSWALCSRWLIQCLCDPFLTWKIDQQHNSELDWSLNHARAFELKYTRYRRLLLFEVFCSLDLLGFLGSINLCDYIFCQIFFSSALCSFIIVVILSPVFAYMLFIFSNKLFIVARSVSTFSLTLSPLLKLPFTTSLKWLF